MVIYTCQRGKGIYAIISHLSDDELPLNKALLEKDLRRYIWRKSKLQTYIIHTKVENNIIEELFKAIDCNNIKWVKALIKDGVDVNAKDIYGRTPLHRAAKAEISKMLIEEGADVSVRDTYGRTPLHLVKNEAEIAKVLIEAGVDANAKDKSGFAPLHYAARYNDLNVVRALIAAGADMNTKSDKNGATALHYAVVANNEDVVKVLIECGADVNAMDEVDCSVLHYAVAGRSVNVIKALITAGADVNAKCGYGFTPLNSTTKEKIRRVLIEAGAKLR